MPGTALRQAWAAAWRLSLAHHPLCTWFHADVFGRRLRVCSGCAVTWPTFLVTMWFLGLAPLRWDWDPWAMAASGLVLGLPQASTLVHRGGRIWRAAVKGLGGFGLALLLAGLLWLPVAWTWKVGATMALVLAAIAFLALRVRSILRVCDACPWARDWGACPGFQAGPGANGNG